HDRERLLVRLVGDRQLNSVAAGGGERTLRASLVHHAGQLLGTRITHVPHVRVRTGSDSRWSRHRPAEWRLRLGGGGRSGCVGGLQRDTPDAFRRAAVLADDLQRHRRSGRDNLPVRLYGDSTYPVTGACEIGGHYTACAEAGVERAA